MNDTQSPFGAYALSGCRRWLLHKAQATPTGWWGRRAALALRRCVLGSGPSRIIDAEVDSLRQRFYTQDNVSERKFLFMPQFFDVYERDILKKNLKPGDTFVDIGANAGIYSLLAAACVGDVGCVVAVEPNPLVLERLRFNVALNGFEKRIVYEQSAVSDAEGMFDLMLDESNLGGSSLAIKRSDKKISVRCEKLLTILQRRGVQKIAALKIDIEGAESKALVPFFQEAPQSLYPAFLVIENVEADLRGMLEKAGYRRLHVSRMNQIWGL